LNGVYGDLADASLTNHGSVIGGSGVEWRASGTVTNFGVIQSGNAAGDIGVRGVAGGTGVNLQVFVGGGYGELQRSYVLTHELDLMLNVRIDDLVVST
jgi:hypothetical protein